MGRTHFTRKLLYQSRAEPKKDLTEEEMDAERAEIRDYSGMCEIRRAVHVNA